MSATLEHDLREAATGAIPRWLKIAYTLFAIYFIAVQVLETPALLLYLCNAAIVITLAGIWLESRLLLGTQLLAVFWPQVIWQIDFVAQAALGVRPFAALGISTSDYMFDSDYPLHRRFASFQHAWLVWMLAWLVWRLGYDRRAFVAATIMAWGLILASGIVLGVFAGGGASAMQGQAGNVNFIFGPSHTQTQTFMPHWAWIALLMLSLPLCQYAPLHFALRGWSGRG